MEPHAPRVSMGNCPLLSKRLARSKQSVAITSVHRIHISGCSFIFSAMKTNTQKSEVLWPEIYFRPYFRPSFQNAVRNRELPGQRPSVLRRQPPAGDRAVCARCSQEANGPPPFKKEDAWNTGFLMGTPDPSRMPG